MGLITGYHKGRSLKNKLTHL